MYQIGLFRKHLYSTVHCKKKKKNTGVEAKYRIKNFKNFFLWSDFSSFFKMRYKSIFLWLTLLFKHFLKIQIQLNMNNKSEKRQRSYDLLNAETKPKFLCLPYSKQRKNTEKDFFKEKMGVEDWTKNDKETF